MKGKHVTIIGGGPAGMQAASQLSELGIEVLLIEKDNKLGGKLNQWDRLFPDQTPSMTLLKELQNAIDKSKVTIRLNTEVQKISNLTHGFDILLNAEETQHSDAVLLTTGFELFDARLKEEYGYGTYPNVITSSDLEKLFREGQPLTTAEGRTPSKIAFLHCVGSRDEKVGQFHCSRVCCITGVKQAIEVKQALPECEVYNFYMDMRMFGAGYEELYREAQEKWGITFIRGRISEAALNQENRIQIKAEDTLAGRPVRLSVDLLVLLVGMTASPCNKALAATSGAELRSNGFFNPVDPFNHSVESAIPGLYFAGTCTAPRNIGETLMEAGSAALKIHKFLLQND
ncbi:MAG: FAD-dependent oxidoreductase [Bacteroidota bacterium]|nr:FAD-dependent oxidoreductase [Bacteroidota bacterium]